MNEGMPSCGWYTQHLKCHLHIAMIVPKDCVGTPARTLCTLLECRDGNEGTLKDFYFLAHSQIGFFFNLGKEGFV